MADDPGHQTFVGLCVQKRELVIEPLLAIPPQFTRIGRLPKPSMPSAMARI
ncbi:hypothetical protein BURPS305_2204 [Burkholderia pseudomallei 305]|nr:hypothetical protein BURPS305_2204 [Burkholderia pseudomallei 305]